MALKIKGDSFAGRYKRVNSYAIDSTDVWDTLEDAHIYARNTDTEPYVPYAGQVISVLENGNVYKLVKDDTISEADGRKHFKLEVIGSTTNNDDRYLRKDIEETMPRLMHFLQGIDVKGVATLEEITLLKKIVSHNFAPGSTGMGIYQDESGNYHLDIDFVNIRRKLTAEELQVQQSSYTGGKQWNTAAGIICNRVEDRGTAWRCYFKTTDAEGRTVRNTFAAGDQALCETFNLSKQAGGKLGNHYYWRLVTATGEDYIDLSKADCDVGSDAPQAGDNIVQLGNRTDITRQGAICWDSVTEGGPYVRVYKGIDAYHLPQPHIDLNPEHSTIKAKLVSEATGQDVSEDISSLQKNMEKVKEQTDKMFVIWFEDYVPTLSNLPASEWTDDATRAEHEQDLFYNTSKSAAAGGGRAYRFEKDASGQYAWVEVTDKDTIAALEAAAKAQDTADGKRRVFVAQPKASDVYDVGDLWVNATYSGGGVAYDNDELVCITAKAAGAAFSISHWKPASTATTAVIKNLGNQIIQVVSDLEDADEAIAAAERLANQGISDANDAYLRANAAYSYASNVENSLYWTDQTVSEHTTAISQTKESIALLAQGKVKNNDGTVSELSGGLVTDARFNSLLSKMVSFDKDGHVTNIDTTGFVTTSNFASQYAQMEAADGYIKRSEISSFITKNADGTFTSNALVSADNIRFNGNIIANDSFIVDKEGNVTMNDTTINNATILGSFQETSSNGFSIQIKPKFDDSDYGGMIAVSPNGNRILEILNTNKEGLGLEETAVYTSKYSGSYRMARNCLYAYGMEQVSYDGSPHSSLTRLSDGELYSIKYVGDTPYWFRLHLSPVYGGTGLGTIIKYKLTLDTNCEKSGI